MPLDRGREPLLAVWLFSAWRRCRLRQFGINNGNRNHFLRIEGSEPAPEVFQLADIAGPVIAFEPIEGWLIELLRRQALAFGLREEVPNQIGHVLDALAQRR